MAGGETETEWPDYIPYDAEDKTCFGAAGVIDHEKRYVFARRPRACVDGPNGLALSGGGIRSASFALGVLQALAQRDWLRHIDYLSTVSGGGYIGSALTWMLHQDLTALHRRGLVCRKRFGLGPDDFPFRTYPMSAESLKTRLNAIPGSGRLTPVAHGKLLRYLRQRARYLTPGDGIDLFSLAAVILRGATLGVLVYLTLLTLLFIPLQGGGLLRPASVLGGATPLQAFTAVCLLVLLLAGLGYGACSRYLAGGSIPSGRAYRMRQNFERWAGRLLKAALVLAVVGSVSRLGQLADALAAGLASLGVGLGSSLAAFRQSQVLVRKRSFLTFWVWLASLALALGLLLVAYRLSGFYLDGGYGWMTIAAMALALGVGGLAHLNYVSLHRYYRDRLMELFMPDLEQVMRDAPSTRAASQADKQPLASLCRGQNPNAPYPIINANVILTASDNPKFRARGGDNFILTPYYCGSNATGWRRTQDFMGNRMTLPTAMAISGAAVNPHSGAGGEGVTRQSLLSQLMAFLNLRLGYWVPNPRWQRFQRHVPNFLIPGLFQVFSPRGMADETSSPWLQLSDGGHFDNMGLYELIRRRCRLIILCDAEADPHFCFTGLANALEKIRADFGTLVELDCRQLQRLVPTEGEGDLPCARTGHLTAAIIYPDNTRGMLIYLKTTFFAGLSADLCSYKKTHSTFPDQSTADQFFDEKQFEAYRELGFQTAWAMMDRLGRPFPAPTGLVSSP